MTGLFIKGTTQDQPRGRDADGKVLGEGGVGDFLPSVGVPPSQHLSVFTNL